jgi:tetratricopeptide (TPR) repeat protein
MWKVMPRLLPVLMTILLSPRPATAQAKEADWKEQLRKLLRPPTMKVGSGITVGRQGVQFPDSPDVAAELPAVRKRLKGEYTDAVRYYRLGELHTEAGEEELARQAFGKAVVLANQWVKAEPKSLRALLQLADCLCAAEKDDEAEAAYRKAVKVAPAAWESWSNLACYLVGRAGRVLIGWQHLPSGKLDESVLITLCMNGKIMRGNADRADRLLEEAARCHEKAISLAPREPLVYLRRVSTRIPEGTLRPGIRLARGETINLSARQVTPELLADLRQAAALEPDNCNTLAGLALFEAFFAAEDARVVLIDDEKGFNSLPDDARRRFREHVAKLKKLSGLKERRGTALELLGTLQYAVSHEFAEAEKNLRAAMALGATHQATRELLLVVLAMQKKYTDLPPVATDLVKYRDTPWNRFVLAKTYFEWLPNPTAAERELRLALKKFPGDVRLNLALVVLILSRSGDAATVKEAGQHLRAAKQAAEEAPRELRAEYDLARAVCYALEGDTESAKSLAREVDLHNLRLEHASKIRKILEEQPVRPPPPPGP